MTRATVTRDAFQALLGACLLLCIGTRAKNASAAAATLHVASKAFTESVIVAELVTQMERSVGVVAEHRVGLGGTRLVWDALLSGAIDVYPEYTGTLTDEILRAELPESPGPPSPAWLARSLAAHGVGMTESLGFNDSYAIGLTRQKASALGVGKISELRGHPELRFGLSNEFISRRDGWAGLRERYALPQTEVQGLDHDLAYRALVSGSIDATDLYTTDAEIRRYGLLALADDAQFFQRYEAVLLYRLDLRARIGDDGMRALLRIQGKISAAQMADMNARAKLDHVPEAEVASDFLRQTLGIAAETKPPSAVRTVLRRTVEHLTLVGVSLLAAILLAIPLGIAAARRPRVGQLVLAAVGVVQTIPTLALLVFMIPLFGIGSFPAVIALFLYSLLPIVRNTHAGLRGIPSSLLESAHALGLPKAATLWRIELPLASPAILAGIKSAAVINVGTATLGALIGAGGLGQLIFTGIRLDNPRLILQGAIPASLLALAVQGVFEIVERSLVPRGLRGQSSW
jgi:osmoprotectant transport system permease protein